MTRPRLTVRELALLVAVVALSIALALEWRTVRSLAVAVELGDREIDSAEARAEDLRAELAECRENLERVDGELREWEAGRRRRAE